MSAAAQGVAGTGARDRLRAIEATIDDLSRVADPRSLASARALVGEVLALHADGLGRVLEILASRPEGAGVIDALAADERVGSLLLLHGLHPVSLEARVRAALAKLAPIDWALELVACGPELVRVVAARAGSSPRAPKAAQVRDLVEQAIDEIAPDADRAEVTVQGDEGEGFVPVARLTAPRPAAGDRQ